MTYGVPFICLACKRPGWMPAAAADQSPEEARIFSGLFDIRLATCTGCGHAVACCVRRGIVRDPTPEEAKRVAQESVMWNELRAYVDKLFSPEKLNFWG